MRIAFDLDDTLIPCEHAFPVEPRGFWTRLFGSEPLRKGTPRLMRALAERRWEIWIYTTSLRSKLSVRLLFLSYGIWIRGVINEYTHHIKVTKSGQPYQDCSKYPPAFGIDVLVDESEGVWMEAHRYGFSMILVSPDDEGWVETVLSKLECLP